MSQQDYESTNRQQTGDRVETLKLIAMLGHPDADECHPWLKGKTLTEAKLLSLVIDKARDAFENRQA